MEPICIAGGGLVKNKDDSVRSRAFEDKNTTTSLSWINIHGRCSQVMWLPSLGSCGCKLLAAHFLVDDKGGPGGWETQETGPPCICRLLDPAVVD